MSDQNPVFTRLPSDRDTGVIRATEIVVGKVVIVIAEHDNGAIGIGNVVRGDRQSHEWARNRCLRHALDRLESYAADRQKRGSSA